MGCLGGEAINVKHDGNKNEKENDKKETLINEQEKNDVKEHYSDINKVEDKKKESGGEKISVKMIKLNDNEQKNNKNIIEENKDNKADEKEIKKENEENNNENNENELKKEVPPNHDYVYVPSNFKKIKESIIAENMEDDNDKTNNNNKLNVSEKSNENLDLNKI